MTAAQLVVFHRPKVGSSEAEWEDGAGYDPGDPAGGRPTRCIVVDGATEAYDSIRWVGQLVESFLGVEPSGGAPRLTRRAMDDWFGLMQKRWLDNAPTAFANLFEERKFREEGSFATLLGCEIEGLERSRPRWTAVAIGDAVLFQVRGGQLVKQFPELGAEDFGLDPDGVFTQPSQRDRMRAGLRLGSEPLLAGDTLMLATDAISAWMVRQAAAGRAELWSTLTEIDHPEQFRRLVADALADGELKNDDITLLRVQITESPPEFLTVCR